MMTINDFYEIPFILTEPVGTGRVARLLSNSTSSIEQLANGAIDDATASPTSVNSLLGISAKEGSILVVDVTRQEGGGVASVDWDVQVHRPLRRTFTVLRGLVPALLDQPKECSVIFAMPLTSLLADYEYTAESVLGRSLIGLAEALRAELMDVDFGVSILLTEPSEDDEQIEKRLAAVIRSKALYSLPSSVSPSAISHTFEAWLGALVETPADLSLPEMGPVGEVYLAEIERHADHEVTDSGGSTAPENEMSRQTRPALSVPREGVPPRSVCTPGKTAIVTGGASGIGLGIVSALLERGMNVVIADVREDHMARALSHLNLHRERVMALKLDVADRQAWLEAVPAISQRFGGIDVLCLNAGIGVLGSILQSTPADWSWLMGVNLGGVTNGLDVILPLMRARRQGGWIIATSSAGGLMVANDGGIYSSAKYGVVAAMDCLRAELAVEGIGVSTLCPAGVNTNIHDHERMRPKEFSASGVRADDAELDRQQARARAMLSQAADPLLVGLRVRDAIDNDVPMVFTDGGIAPILRFRLEAIRAGMTSE